ncbi:hypothetical protein DICPUDRAFT_29527 [Dictyostelium purpureum]|uniref:Uncharacterized protein n=1 Tax=Dictyostelium purpureum TaxID=5786 RepID=F0ZDT9_DICPU|nr:uncharacterized protein DICPUDRAFT_29527 [Dictyostelium purpureum]EGC37924.1 hypothetical protein DICPUDRAFT_29527 [Dictyostelium purpureum]|eukprot:XP_003285584.1 hypothetical protein DICPUDRAFT_29527 [Dictyostelium purpureum]
MCNLDQLEIKKANYQDRTLIASSKIKSINKEVIPSLGNFSPSNSVNSTRKLKEQLIKSLNKNKLKYLETHNIKKLHLPETKEKEFIKYKEQGKENEFLNKKLKIDNSPIANGIKNVYCVFDKYTTKNHIVKVTRPDRTDITPIELLAIYTRAYQSLYREQEDFFDNKKTKIGIHESPTSIYKYGIQDIKYNGLSTIIVFDDFIVCSFDVEQIPKSNFIERK